MNNPIKVLPTGKLVGIAVLLVLSLSMLAASKPATASASNAQLKAAYRTHSPSVVNAIRTYSRWFFSWQSPSDTPILQTYASAIAEKVRDFRSAVRAIRPSSSRGRLAKRQLINALDEYDRTALMFLDATEPLYSDNRGEATTRMNFAVAQSMGAARLMKQAKRTVFSL